MVAQYASKTFTLGVEQRSPQSRLRDAPPQLHRRDPALSALGRCLRRNGRGRVSELQHVARELGALSAVRPAVEAVLA